MKCIPIPGMRKIVDIVDVMDRTSRDVLSAKKQALSQGGEAVLRQVGAGKDIMSVLCKSLVHCEFGLGLNWMWNLQ